MSWRACYRMLLSDRRFRGAESVLGILTAGSVTICTWEGLRDAQLQISDPSTTLPLQWAAVLVTALTHQFCITVGFYVYLVGCSFGNLPGKVSATLSVVAIIILYSGYSSWSSVAVDQIASQGELMIDLLPPLFLVGLPYHSSVILFLCVGVIAVWELATPIQTALLVRRNRRMSK